MFRPHQLELFYYVARYGGISAAVRHIPYGIGQPAVSGQMSDFEREVGEILFHRRPFQLTEQGQLIYDHIRPFHEGLPALWEHLQHQPSQTVRIAAAGTVGPELLAAVIDALPVPPREVRLELLTGRPAELEAWVRDRAVQLAITPAAGRLNGVRSRIIFLPGLRLLVSRKAKIASASHFWSRQNIAEPVICPAETDSVYRRFAEGLQALRVNWSSGIRTESPAIMMHLVDRGHGVGLGLDLPWLIPSRGVQALPLPGFAKVPLLALWRNPASELVKSVLAAVETATRRLWHEQASRVPLLTLVLLPDWSGLFESLV